MILSERISCLPSEASAKAGDYKMTARLHLCYKYRRGLVPKSSGRINTIGGVVGYACPPKSKGRRRNDYYPFGSIMPGGRSSNNASVDGRFKFTGKERDFGETGWDWFGPGRYYDSFIGRWLQVDPLADKYPQWNPYNYALNNPLKLVDPNGMESLPPDPDDETSRNVVGEGPNAGMTKMEDELKSASPEFKKVPEKLLKSLITLSDATSDLSSGVAGAALLTGNIPAATDALTVSMVADITSTGLKGLHAAVYGGSENEFYQQLGETTISIGTSGLTKYGTSKLIESTAGKTGNTLYKNPVTKKFVKNSYGNTVKAVESAINAIVNILF